MLQAVIGLAIFVGALVWLFRAKSADVAAAATVLGMVSVQDKVQSRGVLPEGYAFTDHLLLRGTVAGLPAELAERTVRLQGTPSRQRTSRFSVLSLLTGSAAVRPFRLQPTGLLAGLESLVHERPAAVPTGDAAFDAAYHLYADDAPAALATLTPDLRQAILVFRTSVAGDLPASAAGKMASGLLLGSFLIEPERASYSLYGTPSKKIAMHLLQAAPLLARLAGRR